MGDAGTMIQRGHQGIFIVVMAMMRKTDEMEALSLMNVTQMTITKTVLQKIW